MSHQAYYIPYDTTPPAKQRRVAMLSSWKGGAIATHLESSDVPGVQAALLRQLGVEIKVQHLAAVHEVIEAHLYATHAQ